MRRRTWLLFVLICLTYSACTAYNPSLYTGYDILNPSADVRANPLGTVDHDAETSAWEVIWDDIRRPDPAQSYFIVDTAFIQWVGELKEEVKKLRKK